MRCTNVVIADRHPIVLQGLSRLLGADGDFNIVASCSDGASCIEALRKFGPDIAILGVSIPGVTESGNSLPHQFRESCHATDLFHRN